MKSKLWLLVKGELVRLKKYGVFSISLFVAVMWGTILFLISENVLGGLLPFILFIDATMMSIMYIGAEMHFEKSESTISTMLVTPVTNKELVASKIIANTIHNLMSSLLIVLVFFIASKTGAIMDLGMNIGLIILGIVVVTSTFTVLGLVLSYYQKDFTEMLVNMFIIVIVLMIPSVLLTFKVIEGQIWENIMLFNPMQGAQNIIQGGFADPVTGELEFGYRYFVSLGYMFIGGILMYFLLAVPKFQDYAIKQSGV